MNCTIGIDLGTSGCRIAILDDDASCLALTSVDLPAPIREGVNVEQDARLWWTACQQALQQALDVVPAKRIRAIAIDGTSSSLLPASANGEPLGPALMYNDARASLEAKQLDSLAPAESAVHSPTSSLAKLLWLQQHFTLEDSDRVLHQADWLAGRFSGRYDISDENNALKLGYDPQTRRWPGWLSELELPAARLPEVVPAGSPIGPILPDIAGLFGLPDDCLVIAGTTDSTAAFIATGACEPGEAVTCLGSTLVMKVLSDTPVFAPDVGVYSHRLGDQWLVGGASNSGCAVLAQFFSNDELKQLSRKIDPATHSGLDYYPLPGKGERFPINDPAMQPVLAPRPDADEQFLHGLFDGLATIEYRAYKMLEKLGAPAAVSVRTIGGGAINPVWKEIRQRQLRLPLLEPAYSEAACGAALIARKGLQANPA